MPQARHTLVLAGLVLVAACSSPSGVTPSSTRLTGRTPLKTAASASPSDAASPDASPTEAPASPPTQPYFGLVLDESGKPAAGVPIVAYLISNNGGGIVSNNGSGLISDKGGSYKLLDTGLTATTDAQGHFTLNNIQGAINVEADQSDSEKAIAFNVASDATGVQLHLAPTGSISGKVTATKAPSVTHFIGVQVFVPGTGYEAATADDGSFTISHVPVGTYALYATKQGLGSATVGDVTVASNKTASATLDLAVTQPTIASVTPSIAGPGAAVTITGTHFGASDGSTFTVSVGGEAVSNPTRVDDQTIKVTIPSGATSGNVDVTVGGIPSNALPITLLSALSLNGPLNGVLVGGKERLAATGTDATGTVALDPTMLGWTSDASTAVSVDASGTATGVAAGKATITATSGSLKATFKLNAYTAAPAVVTYQGTAAHTVGGLAFDAAGNLYETDAAQPLVEKFAPDGTGTSVYAGSGWGNHVLAGIAIDAQRNLFVSDEDGNRILKIDATGHESVLAGPADSLVLDPTTQQDQGPSGLTNGSGGTVRFNAPQGLVLDGAGNLIVADSGNNCLRKIDASGNVSTFVTGLNGPTGLARDAQGNLYVACAGDGTLQKVNAQGAVIQFAASAGTDSSPFVGVALTPNGNLYAICAPINNSTPTISRVYQVNSNGSLTAIAGGNFAALTGALDGPGSSATFFTLSGLTATPNGNLIVGDASPGIATMREILLAP